MKFSGSAAAMTSAVAIAIFLVIAIYVTVTRDSLVGDLAFYTFLWAGVALAWNLTAGFAGRLSLGHAAYFGFGAYAAAILFEGYGISPWIALVVGMAFAAGLAATVELATVRLAGVYYSLATFAMAELIGILARGWRELTGGTGGITMPFEASILNMTFIGKTGYVWLAFGYVVLVFGLISGLLHARFGFFLKAQRDDPDAARSVGVNPERVRLIAGILSAMLTAAGGTLYAQYLLFVDPEVAFSWQLSVKAALIGIIGGLGTVSGPIWGALLLIPAERWLLATMGGTYGGLASMIYGLVLIAAVLLAPRGIASVLERRRAADKPRETVAAAALVPGEKGGRL